MLRMAEKKMNTKTKTKKASSAERGADGLPGVGVYKGGVCVRGVRRGVRSLLRTRVPHN